MKIVVAGTGASGALYLQRLLDMLGENGGVETHLVLTDCAREVIATELGELRTAAAHRTYDNSTMTAPFASGSAVFDAMVVVPCSMGMLGRIAHGVSDSLIARAADVFLKERRKLILVPRETPWNLIHARNAATLIEAGAVVLPASPSFYLRPQTVTDVADTVVWRILDQLEIPVPSVQRWGEDTLARIQ